MGSLYEDYCARLFYFSYLLYYIITYIYKLGYIVYKILKGDDLGRVGQFVKYERGRGVYIEITDNIN